MEHKSSKNIKLILAYDGTAYLGWQKTSLGPNIEQLLQTALENLLGEKTTLQAASRTDAGVHAQGQVVNFFSPVEPSIDDVNALLPKDIRILELAETHPHFHPTLDCSGKTYHYTICQGPIQLPHHRLYSWHVPSPLNISDMKEAAQALIGIHDFSAFCNVKNNEVYADKVRHLQSIQFEMQNNQLKIVLTGKNFLYKMARNIAGTLIYVGLGKIPLNQIPLILQNRDRTQAGVSAPAHGLTLATVHY